MTAPTTDAGRALQDEYPGIWHWEDPRWDGPLGPAIEQEAVTRALDTLAREMNNRRVYGECVYCRAEWDEPHHEGAACTAVLALIEQHRPKGGPG